MFSPDENPKGRKCLTKSKYNDHRSQLADKGVFVIYGEGGGGGVANGKLNV